MDPHISVVIPAYNASNIIGCVLKSLQVQTFTDFEVIVVDDGSTDDTENIVRGFKDVKFRRQDHKGPAAARNLGIKTATGDIIAFTDTDCAVDRNWLKNMAQCFTEDVSAIMGRVNIPESTFVGDSISALGFPAGGSVGFENMWKVFDGFTDHLSTCNCAVKKSVFEKFGYFDETFRKACNEDTELSYRLEKNNVKIKYCPDVVISHDARTGIVSFLCWNLRRGEGNYYFKQRVENVKGFVKLRLWSTKNILRKYCMDRKIIMILILLFLSFVFQQIGYLKEKFRR